MNKALTHFLNLKIYYFPSDFDPEFNESHEAEDGEERELASD